MPTIKVQAEKRISRIAGETRILRIAREVRRNMQAYEKDPDSTLDYGWDWEDWLAESDDDDSIDDSTWVVPDGLVSEDESQEGTQATVWLSGGVLGSTYIVVNRITTTNGRTEDRSFTVFIVDR